MNNDKATWEFNGIKAAITLLTNRLTNSKKELDKVNKNNNINEKSRLNITHNIM